METQRQTGPQIKRTQGANMEKIYAKVRENTFRTKIIIGCILLFFSICCATTLILSESYTPQTMNSKNSYTTSTRETVGYKKINTTQKEHMVNNWIDEDKVSLTYKQSKIFFLLIIPPFLIGLLQLLLLLRTQLKIKRLKKKGQLIKAVPCKIKSSNTSTMNQAGFYILIDYRTQEGKILKLKSDLKYYNNIVNAYKADILTDPNNPKDYYIDFDISCNSYNNYEI